MTLKYPIIPNKCKSCIWMYCQSIQIDGNHNYECSKGQWVSTKQVDCCKHFRSITNDCTNCIHEYVRADCEPCYTCDRNYRTIPSNWEGRI